MTSIDRARFVRDLSDLRIPVRSLTPDLARTFSDAGLEAPALDSIAGSDHVIHGAAEYERLYDRLVALDRASGPPRPGASSNLDRARAVYEAMLGRCVADPEPLANGTARDRTTGIGAGPSTPGAPSRGAAAAPIAVASASTLASLPGAAPFARSDYVRLVGESRARELEPRARTNVLGPEASSQRRIRALTENVSAELRELEDRMNHLEPGSTERRGLEERIEATVQNFESTLASESAFVDHQRRQPSRGALEDLTRALPPYLRDTVERRGLVIPGAPGAIAPRFSAPYGVDWKLRF